ncbi:MAG TPA: plastocyanin/azurin family copper-binding protein [Candidatus Limnocylindria bacterium]|nr:plastocyanin/azurin family copper-binding protein [Candidatus Limnocylindria bacterium]
MHRSRPLAILVLVLLLAACSNNAASSAPAADGGGAATDDGSSGGGETVSLAGFAFSPSELTIPAGTTVTFTDTANHTVTEGTDGEAVDDPIVDEDGGSDIEVTFDEPGTYNITCKIHPDMNMTITVEG